MTAYRIALVRYTPAYFLPFGRGLEAAGFDVHWINSLQVDCQTLAQAGVPDAQILDTTAGFDATQLQTAQARRILGALEQAVDGPRIHDIILMDRLLRRKPLDFALRYLAHVAQVVEAFLTARRIDLVTSGRDTALQIITMLVCRRLGIPWVVPTRARIPQEMYGFCQRHDTEGLIRMREVTDADRTWAADCLAQFSQRTLRPALKKSARGFGDVLRLLPGHLRVFAYELQRSGPDRGRDHVRYTVPRLIGMYLLRRLNMLSYKLRPPYRAPGETPFALYALHTQPESSIDVVGSYFSDQVHLVRSIARSLPATHELYVKVHPTDVDGKPASFYSALAEIPGVRLIGHQVDSRELLQKMSLLFALSGTIAYEAGLLGRPVIAFARNYFNSLPTIRHCTDMTALPALVARQLDAAPPVDLQAMLIEFLAELRACCFDGEVNRTYGASTAGLNAGDLAGLQLAYRSLAQVLLAQPGGRPA